MDFQKYIKHYQAKFAPRAKRQIEWFQVQSTVEEAIEVAALAKDSRGKRYRHQARIPKNVLQQAKQILLNNIDKISCCRNFDKLHLLIEFLIQDIRGIGELYIYDTSLRVGAKLNLFPTYVYLHSGTKEGAKKLGINTDRRFMSITELPGKIAVLRPYEIEDFLCIYKSKGRS